MKNIRIRDDVRLILQRRLQNEGKKGPPTIARCSRTRSTLGKQG